MSQTKAQLISDLVQALNFTGTASAPANGAFLSATNTLALATNSAQRLTIDSSGRVGIGTDNPAAQLDAANNLVIGSTSDADSGITLVSTTSGQSLIHFSDATSGNARYDGFLGYEQTGRFLKFGTAQTERMRIDSSGNVLIGTTSATAEFTVQGGGTVASFEGTGGSGGIAIRDADAGTFVFLKDDGGTFSVQTSGSSYSDKFAILPDGNVGIGTTSPSNKLEITNTTSDKGILIKTTGNTYHTICGDANRTSSSDNILRIDSKWNGTVVNRIRMLAGADTTNKDDGIMCFDTASGGSMGERMRIDSSGRVGIGTSSPDAMLHLSGTNPFIRFTDTVDSSHYAHIGHSDTSVFLIDADAANAHADSGIEFKVDNSSVMFLKNGGNVGIGTTSPQRRLHQHVSTSGANYHSFTNDTTGSGSSDGLLLGINLNEEAIFWNYENTDMRFATNGTDRLIIDNAGKVGIGTTSPTQTLDVTASNTVGIAQFTNTATSFSNSCYTVHIDSSAHTSNMTSAGAFAVDVNAGRAMTINGNGDVGIGTSSPTDKLHVVGDVEFTLGTDVFDVMTTGSGSKHPIRLLNADASANNEVGIQFGPANNVVGASIQGVAESDFTSTANRDGALSFTTRLNGTLSEAMRINSSGYVGIGTASPHRTLHQHVSSSAANYHQFTNSTTGSGAGDGALVGIDANENLILWNVENIPIRFGTNNSERMRILNGGNLVINATALPVVGTEKLGVHGGTGSTSVGIAAVCTHNEGIPFFASNSSNSFSDRLMRFAAGSGGDTRGTITFNGSVMVYGGASDYRLKENITSISNGITKLKDLKPINFNWIKDETNTSIMGFLAHEVQEVMPQVVVGTKDEVNSEGKPEYQEIDLGGISPLIVAALQEAISKIETLETKVAALEAA